MPRMSREAGSGIGAGGSGGSGGSLCSPGPVPTRAGSNVAVAPLDAVIASVLGDVNLQSLGG